MYGSPRSYMTDRQRLTWQQTFFKQIISLSTVRWFFSLLSEQWWRENSADGVVIDLRVMQVRGPRVAGGKFQWSLSSGNRRRSWDHDLWEDCSRPKCLTPHSRKRTGYFSPNQPTWKMKMKIRRMKRKTCTALPEEVSSVTVGRRASRRPPPIPAPPPQAWGAVQCGGEPSPGNCRTDVAEDKEYMKANANRVATGPKNRGMYVWPSTGAPNPMRGVAKNGRLRNFAKDHTGLGQGTGVWKSHKGSCDSLEETHVKCQLAHKVEP